MFQISIDLIALVAFRPHTAVHWADKKRRYSKARDKTEVFKNRHILYM